MLSKVIKPGDTIGVIASSDLIRKKDLDDINKSKKLFEDLGYKVKFGKYASTNTLGYGATAKQRAEDINNMFADEEVKAIIVARGGEDSNSTFDYINYEIIKSNPKIICGFSDSTSLTNAIYAKTGLVTFNGPTFKSLTSWETDYAFKELIKRFQDKSLELCVEEDQYETLKEGIAEGELVGGNLSLTTRLVTGKYSLDFTNKILFIEELGYESSPNLVNNNLYYMKQNGVFNKRKGIWLGINDHETEILLEKI
jgi:muramoyltetrapeptide carboxypeptidase